MKKIVTKFALVTATVASLFVAGCSKNEIETTNTPTSKSRDSIGMTLEWTNNGTKCQYVGYVGAYDYHYYISDNYVGVYSNHDTSAVTLTPTTDGYTVNFASIPISYLTFSIKDITTGVNDTVSFSFYVNNILANKFKMYGGMTFLSDVLGRGSANDEQSELREAPLFRFFENGTAKLICDCSLYQIPVSAFSPMNAYDANIIHCLKAMSDHINDLSAHQVYSTFNHQKNHNYPTHNGCILLCNGVQVNL